MKVHGEIQSLQESLPGYKLSDLLTEGKLNWNAATNSQVKKMLDAGTDAAVIFTQATARLAKLSPTAEEAMRILRILNFLVATV